MPIEAPQTSRVPWYVRLHELMPHRVREILLVSSSYDAFILEEDGPLTERIFTSYSEMNLSWAPRITHVTNLPAALAQLSERRFDLVIAMPRIEDADVSTLGRELKKRDPSLPVVLLTFSEADLRQLHASVDVHAIDRVFVWTGDARILIAINKLVEDELNLKHDCEAIGVPAIIFVEDSPHHASTFLTELYTELMVQSQSLAAEGVNNLHKLLRMRTRPKVLHARSFEEAHGLFDRLQEHVFALITDMRFPRAGVLDPEAGFRLIESFRNIRADLPVLVQSAETDIVTRARERDIPCVDKNSPQFIRELRAFVTESLGFGDFVFRLPDRTEVARARDMYEMEHVLKYVPAESLLYHASRNHFSIWFTARGLFEVSSWLRSKKVNDFAGIEALRAYLIETLARARTLEQEGIITDFGSRAKNPNSIFVRLGEGSIGGKARGIAFANYILARAGIADQFPGLSVRIPRTVVIGVEEFERFVERNRLLDAVRAGVNDRQLLQRFLDGYLSEEFLRDLRSIWEELKGPLAVRSSSLLEDLHFQPFSGVYATYMLPNNHPEPEVRFTELCQAVKAVYASTYSENARTYIAGTPFRPEEEKMGIVIQEMVGAHRGDHFYPHFSGVALSYNYYPIHGQGADDGTALIAVGLGHTIVLGGSALRFCPASPGVLPQFKTPGEFVRSSQKTFYGLDLTRPRVDFPAGQEASLKLLDIEAAFDDGIFASVGSTYSAADNTLREGSHVTGQRVVTFNNILKWDAIPLAAALSHLLRRFRQGMGCAVEIEFAVDMGDWGRTAQSDRPAREPVLNVLQIRPLATHFLSQEMEPQDFPAAEVICHTDRALGHGHIENIFDLVYVRRDALDKHATPEIARQLGEINRTLQQEARPFMLVGPGRWGSSDPRLGIPVEWRQIAGARVIAETRIRDREVEPSQGSHFFQNITSLGVGYLTLSGLGRQDDAASFIDMDWLDTIPAHRETSAVRHLRFDKPLRIYLNGRRGDATILRPETALSAAT